MIKNTLISVVVVAFAVCIQSYAQPFPVPSGLSSNAVVQRVPFIQMFPDGNILIWDGTNSFQTNFPASTTFGMNEVQQMFPWRTNGAIWTGGKIMMAAGEYDFTTPIIITNNWTIEGAGHLSTVWKYTGTTNGFTVAAMTNAFAQHNVNIGLQVANSLVVVPTNKLAVQPISEFTYPAPNVIMKGITIMTSTNMPVCLFYSRANSLFLDDMGFGGSDYLNGVHGAYRVGYLNKSDVRVPSGVVGAWICGDGNHVIQNSDFGGLADSLAVDTDGWCKISGLTMHVAGQFISGNTNMYPTNAAAAFLGQGFHIYNRQSYNTSINDVFYDEANYDLIGSIPIYSINGMNQTVQNFSLQTLSRGLIEFANDNLSIAVGFLQNGLPYPPTILNDGDLYVNGAFASDYQETTSPLVHTDGGGNLTAASFSGDGSGLTGIPSTSITGGMTTNIDVLLSGGVNTKTLYFTNGILMKVAAP